jgi:L-asparaginase II
MTDPVLVELTRGRLVESAHQGAIAVCDAGGALRLALGDVVRPVFPRSAIKAFQCLPLIESGAADRYGFADAEIALACASHSGTPAHVACAERMLAAAGLAEPDLGCGAHLPIREEDAAALIRAGRRPCQLHNNCSGKHAGMVATAAHMGEPVAGYLAPDHPVQRRIAAALAAMTGAPVGPDVIGVDGCSAPNWAVPLAGLATAFARLATGEGPARAHRAAAGRILRAAWAAPDMVAGPGRLDTVMMRALPGRVFMKTGAEGVYCGAIPAAGLGFAIKITDGAKRASELATHALLARLVPGAGEVPFDRALTNWRGTRVGEVRIAQALAGALDRLAV